MKPNLKQLSVICLGLVLLVGFTLTATARPRTELESLATSEAVPGLVQKAAVKALADVYVKSDLSVKKLESIAKGDKAALREAAIPALVEKYGDVSQISTRKKAQKKAKELRKKAVSGETKAIKEAAGKALATFFTSFNLNGVKGYSTEELEALGPIISEKEKFSGLQVAVTEALASIYPNPKSVDELKKLIKETDSEMIREAAYKALSVRYSSPLSPTVKFEELRKMAKNKDLSEGERMAAGIAFGKLAAEKMGTDNLVELAKNGSTQGVRKGGGIAAAEALKNDPKITESDLLELYDNSKKYTTAFDYAVTKALAYKLERPPRAVPDAYRLEEDGSLELNGPGVLANDRDADGDELYSNLVSEPSHGNVTLGTDGSFTYEPGSNYLGKDSFTYKVTDRALESEAKNVKLTVKPVNDPPVAADDEVTINLAERFSKEIDLLANDSDPEGDKMTLVTSTSFPEGHVELDKATGEAKFVSNVATTGSFNVTYTIKDEKNLTAEAKVEVEVIYDPETA